MDFILEMGAETSHDTLCTESNTQCKDAWMWPNNIQTALCKNWRALSRSSPNPGSQEDVLTLVNLLLQSIFISYFFGWTANAQTETYILMKGFFILSCHEAQRLEITASEHPNSSDIVLKEDDLSLMLELYSHHDEMICFSCH